MNTGDRVKKRGLDHLGTVLRNNEGWVTVEWDRGEAPRERPRICHQRELQEAP